MGNTRRVNGDAPPKWVIERSRRQTGPKASELPMLEIMLDNSSEPAENLASLVEVVDYLKRSGYPLKVKVFYTPEQIREQMGIVDLSRLTSRSFPTEDAIVQHLRDLDQYLEIAPDSALIQEYTERLLLLAQAVARRNPASATVKTSLEALGFSSAQELQDLKTLEPWQAQILYTHFIFGKSPIILYPDLAEARNLNHLQERAASDSIIRHAHFVSGEAMAQKNDRLCMVVSKDDRIIERLTDMSARGKQRFAGVQPERFRQLLQALVDDCANRFPGGEEPPHLSVKGCDPLAEHLAKTLMASQRLRG